MRVLAIAAASCLVACNAINGVGDYDFGDGSDGGAVADGGSAGAGATGGTGTAGGGDGGAGATGGGSGGVGGAAGGAPPTLVDRGLLVRYYIEGDGVSVPTTVLDHGPNGFDLPVTPDANMTHVVAGGNGGLSWAAPGGLGFPAELTAGSPIATLTGRTQATIEVVADVEACGAFCKLTFVGINNEFGRLAMSVNSTSNITLYTHPGRNDKQGNWTADAFTRPRSVYHIVIDSTLATQVDRTRLFIDGVQAANDPNPTGSPLNLLAQDETLDMGEGVGSHLVLGNKFAQAASSAQTLFYTAVYDVALTSAEVVHNAGILAQSDEPPVP